MLFSEEVRKSFITNITSKNDIAFNVIGVICGSLLCFYGIMMLEFKLYGYLIMAATGVALLVYNIIRLVKKAKAKKETKRLANIEYEIYLEKLSNIFGDIQPILTRLDMLMPLNYTSPVCRIDNEYFAHVSNGIFLRRINDITRIEPNSVRQCIRILFFTIPVTESWFVTLTFSDGTATSITVGSRANVQKFIDNLSSIFNLNRQMIYSQNNMMQ